MTFRPLMFCYKKKTKQLWVTGILRSLLWCDTLVARVAYFVSTYQQIKVRWDLTAATTQATMLTCLLDAVEERASLSALSATAEEVQEGAVCTRPHDSSPHNHHPTHAVWFCGNRTQTDSVPFGRLAQSLHVALPKPLACFLAPPCCFVDAVFHMQSQCG